MLSQAKYCNPHCACTPDKGNSQNHYTSTLSPVLTQHRVTGKCSWSTLVTPDIVPIQTFVVSLVFLLQSINILLYQVGIQKVPPHQVHCRWYTRLWSVFLSFHQHLTQPSKECSSKFEKNVPIAKNISPFVSWGSFKKPAKCRLERGRTTL